eukprot:TRINITY_DN6208_c0_g3_i1.p1 TRINITY_DN6208_c0_g3~~TRINITY_DN6208_c0_g3_i1.p1  ORF type:complete len:579 (+),score=139.72 TRINITY_DN6208_c0_g3_i1:82-1818(+)
MEKTTKSLQDCRFFILGSCNKGDACEFRHSEAARTNPRECAFYPRGKCTNPDCGFRHSLPDPTLAAANQKVPVCKFFKEGKCHKGVACPFKHDFSHKVYDAKVKPSEENAAESVTEEAHDTQPNTETSDNAADAQQVHESTSTPTSAHGKQTSSRQGTSQSHSESTGSKQPANLRVTSKKVQRPVMMPYVYGQPVFTPHSLLPAPMAFGRYPNINYQQMMMAMNANPMMRMNMMGNTFPPVALGSTVSKGNSHSSTHSSALSQPAAGTATPSLAKASTTNDASMDLRSKISRRPQRSDSSNKGPIDPHHSQGQAQSQSQSQSQSQGAIRNKSAIDSQSMNDGAAAATTEVFKVRSLRELRGEEAARIIHERQTSQQSSTLKTRLVTVVDGKESTGTEAADRPAIPQPTLSAPRQTSGMRIILSNVGASSIDSVDNLNASASASTKRKSTDASLAEAEADAKKGKGDDDLLEQLDGEENQEYQDELNPQGDDAEYAVDYDPSEGHLEDVDQTDEALDQGALAEIEGDLEAGLGQGDLEGEYEEDYGADYGGDGGEYEQTDDLQEDDADLQDFGAGDGQQ